MPTYEYVCDACGHGFDEFQSITAKPLRKCPECGKTKLRRLIGTGAGVIFRGSGFYQTDYRSESYKKAAKAEKDHGKSKSDGEGKAKSESKPAEKSESTPAKKAENKAEKKSD